MQSVAAFRGCKNQRSPARVAIVSVANDLHALAVADLVRQRETDCVIVESNRVSGSGPLSWSSDPGSSVLTTSAGPWRYRPSMSSGGGG
jgi:hypothetical protein